MPGSPGQAGQQNEIKVLYKHRGKKRQIRAIKKIKTRNKMYRDQQLKGITESNVKNNEIIL